MLISNTPSAPAGASRLTSRRSFLKGATASVVAAPAVAHASHPPVSPPSLSRELVRGQIDAKFAELQQLLNIAFPDAGETFARLAFTEGGGLWAQVRVMPRFIDYDGPGYYEIYGRSRGEVTLVYLAADFHYGMTNKPIKDMPLFWLLPLTECAEPDPEWSRYYGESILRKLGPEETAKLPPMTRTPVGDVAAFRRFSSNWLT